VGAGNVLVVGSGTSQEPFVIVFIGTFAYVQSPTVTGDGTNLVGAISVNVSASTPDSAGLPIQTISLSGASGGTFTLSGGSSTTSALAWNASAADVATALEAVPGIGGQVVSVAGNAGGPWDVAFQPGSNLAPLTADNSQLTGGEISVTPIQVVGSPTIQVSLVHDPSYVVTSQSAAAVTIAENFPPQVIIAATKNTADEHLGTPGEFTVTRIGPLTEPLTVDYTVSGSAANYSPLPGLVIIPVGQTTATIDVVPIDENLQGLSLTVTAAIATPSDGSYAVGSPAGATVTLLEDDPPQVSIQATQAFADEMSGAAGVLTVTRTGPTAKALLVDYAVGGNATNYQSLLGSVIIPAGQSTATISIIPFDANLAGPDENATLTLTVPSDGSYAVIQPSNATVVVIEDAPPAVMLQATTPIADEATDAAGVFTVTRNSGLMNPLTVAYSIAGTAIAGEQYQQLSGTVVIPAGQASAPINIVPIDAGQFAGSASVALTLLPGGSHYTAVSPSSDTVTVLEDDVPAISVAATAPDASKTDGTNGAFTITRTGPTTNPLTISLSLSGTAVYGGDYQLSGPGSQSVSTSVTIPASASSALVTVAPTNDGRNDGDETVILGLTAATGYKLANQAAASVTIHENSLPVVSIVATQPSANETTGAAGVFTVTRTGATTSSLVVNFSLAGAARSGTDFQAIGTSVTIPAGASSTTININPINDGANTTVRVVLSSSTSYQIGSSSNDAVTIAPAPTITIAATQYIAYDPTGLPGTFTVTRTGSTGAPLVVHYAVSGTAVSGTQYESLSGYVTIPAGSATATVTVYPITVSGLVGPETVVVTLVAPGDSSYLVGSLASDTVALEGPPTASIQATQSYANEQTGTVGIFTVSLNEVVPVAAVLGYSVAGSAVSGTDFQPLSGTIVVSAGSSSVTIPIKPLNAHHASGTENVTITLSAASDGSYFVGTPTSDTVVMHNVAPPTMTIRASVPDASLPQNTAGQFTITRSGDTSGAVTIPLSISGSAVAGTDYQAIATPVTIPAGQTTVTIAVTPVSGDYFTGSRAVSLALAAASDFSYQLGSSANATVAITGDPLPAVSVVATPSIASLPAGQSATLTISRTGPTPDPLTVDLAFGGPAVEGTDYQVSGAGFQASSSTVTIPAGSASTTLTVTALNNNQFVTTANVSLLSSSTYNFGSLSTTAVMIIEQLPTVILAATQNTADAPSHTPGTFTVTRNGPTTSPLTVSFSISGTGVINTDYQLGGGGVSVNAAMMSGSVTIAAGASSTTITVTPLVDASGANTETVVLSLNGSASYAAGNPSTDTVTIDQDLVPAIQVYDGVTYIPPNTGSDNLGATPVDQWLIKTFTVVNTSTKNVYFYGPEMELLQQQPANFGIDQGLPSPPSAGEPAFLAPGQSASITLEFAGSKPGSYTCTVAVYDSDATAFRPYTFTLNGSVTPAQPSNVTVDHFGLVDDTGISSSDLVTSDPRVAATVDGWFRGGSAVVQFNDNGNATGSTSQITGSGTTFVYDPRQDDASLNGYTGAYDIKYRLLLYDASGNLVSTGGWSDFSLTIAAPQTAPYVADCGLVNDTGPVSTPPSTYDPRVQGTVQGIAAGDTVDVQFDHNGNLTPFSTSPGINASGDSFAYDPSSTDPSLVGYSGPLTIDYRLVEHDASGNVVYTSNWTAFNMAMYVPTPTLTVDNLHLPDDTDPTSPTPASVDPTLAGQVDGTLLGQAALLEFSNQGNGSVDNTISIWQTGQTLTYDPLTTTSLAQFIGVLPLAYRVVEFDAEGGTMCGPWHSFPITIEAAPSATTIQNLQLVHATISQNPLATSDPTISATIVGHGSPFSLLSVQVYYNGDTTPDQTFSGSYNHLFTDKLPNLPYGQNTIKMRVVETPLGASYPLYGGLTTLTFDFEPPPPPTINLWVNGKTTAGTVATPEIVGVLSGGASINNLVVEFHLAQSGPIIGEATSNSSGAVSFAPLGLNRGPVTVYARSVVPNPAGGLSYGAWASVSFTYAPTPGALPAISNLALANAPQTTTTSSTAPTVSDATITGQVTKSDGRTDFQTVDFYYNNDTTVDGMAITAADGTFTFVPKNLPAGPVTVNAQAAVWDDASQSTLESKVTSLSFIYQPPASSVPTIGSLSLVNDLGTNGTHAATDPTVQGQISPPSGSTTSTPSVAFLTVQFDTNDDGVPDASVVADATGSFQFTPAGLSYGSVTIQSRVAQYNYATGATNYSAWSPLTFTYQAPQNRPPSLVSFALASVTGTTVNDTPTTANPAVRGQINQPTDASNLVVEFFVNGQTTPCGYASPDAKGNFIYTPQSLAYGAVTVTASLRQWDTTQNNYVQRDSKQVSFTYNRQTDAAPALTSLSMIDANGQPIAPASGSTYPATTAPVIGGQLSYQGSLSGLTVQFDTTGGTTTKASVVTDQYGDFTFTPVGLAYGTVTVNARTQVLDAKTHQLLTGPWTPITFTYQQPPANAPTIGTFQLASSSTGSGGAITASDPTVTGQVSFGTSAGGSPPSVADLTVQIQVNGTIVGTTLTDAHGNFSYTPSGLALGSSVTIAARALDTDQSGNSIQGAWSTPITFTVTSSDTTPSIGSLNIVDSFGNPIASLVTNYPIVLAQVTYSGTLSGITVQLDTNGDGQPDSTATTNAQGQVKFWPSGLPQGVVAVAARTSVTASDGTTTTSPWTELKFVYSLSPSSSQAQSLAAPLVAQAQAANAAEGTSESKQATAGATLQQSLAAASSTQESSLASATATYNSSASAAESTFTSQASSAESNFNGAIQSYQGNSTSYTVKDFAWPSAPSTAEMPADPQPEPPAPPSADTGPTFDVTQDPGYQSAVQLADQAHDVAVAGATQQYQIDVGAANNTYDQAISQAAGIEEQALASANAPGSTATNPYDVAAATAAYYQTLTGLQNANSTTPITTNYSNQTATALAAELAGYKSDKDTANSAMLAANQILGQYYHPGPAPDDAWDDPEGLYDAWLDAPFRQPIWSHVAVWWLSREQAAVQWGLSDDVLIEAYADTVAGASEQEEQGLANASYQEATGAATAQFNLSETIAEAANWTTTTGAIATYSETVARDAAMETFTAAAALAEQNLEDSLAKAASDRTGRNADAESTLTQAVANAAAAATAGWATSQGTPWAQYQASLAEDDAQYVTKQAPQQDQLLHAQAKADYTKAKTLDLAAEQDATAVAQATQAQADATAAAAKQFAIDTSTAALAVAISDATAQQNETNAIAAANLNATLVRATADYNYATLVAKATRALEDATWGTALNIVEAEIAQNAGEWHLTPLSNGTVPPGAMQAYQLAVAQAANNRDHVELPAELTQYTTSTKATVAYDNTVRDLATGLAQTSISAKHTEADQLAQAQHDATYALAQAQHDLETATAKADALGISLSATADQAYGDVLPGFQKSQDISDAQALEQFETGPLNLYASQLANWSSTEGTPWAAEQAAFTAADAGLATSLADANVTNVTAIDGANITWTQSMDSAIANRADDDAAAAVTAEEGIADAQLTEAKALADAELAHTQGLDAANSTEQSNDAGAAGTAADYIESAHGAQSNALAQDSEVLNLALSDINLGQVSGSMSPDAAATAAQNAQNAKTTSDAAAAANYVSAVKGANYTLTIAVDTQVSDWSTTMTGVNETWEQDSTNPQATLTGSLATADAGLAAADAQDLSGEQIAEAQAGQTLATSTSQADQTLAHSTAVADAANAVACAQAEGNYAVGRAANFANQLAAAATSSGDPLLQYQATVAAAQKDRAINDATALVNKEIAVTSAEIAASDQQQADQATLSSTQEGDHVNLVTEESPLEAQKTADQADAEATAAGDDAKAKAAQTIADADASIEEQNAVTQATVQNDINVANGQASNPNPPAISAAATTEKQKVAAAAVTLATAEGQVEVTLATSLANAANSLASQEQTFQDQTAGQDEAAVLYQQGQNALAAETETAAVGLAEADYQEALGNDAVTEATAASGAEADFAIALATQEATAAQALETAEGSQSPTTNEAAFQAVYAQAYVNWLTDTRSAYVTHGTALAQDEANYEYQLATDQENLANAEATEAVSITNAESPLISQEVDGEAANDNAYSAALSADQGAEAITIAGADQTQELALASAQANQTGQSLINAKADANLQWVNTVAGAEASAATQDATAQKNDVTGNATLEDNLAHSDSGEVDAQTKADASYQTTQAEDDANADAGQQNADAAAEVAFNTALYNATSTQWSNLASSVNMPWTQYRAGLAAAVAAWYTSNSSTYTSLVDKQATAEINYSINDVGQFLTEADNVADDQQTETNAVADAAQTDTNTQAQDQFTFAQAVSTAWSNEQIGSAQASHDYTESGNSAALNAAMATLKSNWITGQSSAIGNLATSNANAALAESTAHLNAAETEQEGSSTAELPQIDQYDDTESGDYDTQQKADDLALAGYQSTWAASYATAIAAYNLANPSPWAGEAAALAAASSTQAGSLATAQQNESDGDADVEKQAETTETDAEAQFAESQVGDEHDLEVSQATNAAAEVGSDLEALDTQAPSDPTFTQLPDALSPPAALAAPPVGGGSYNPDATSLDPYDTGPYPAIDPQAAGNYGSWLGWNAITSAGGLTSLEAPNLSGTGGSLADAAFAALALLQGEVQVVDAAVRADDATTGADGSKTLPLLDPTTAPPAPGTVPASPSMTPPTPMGLEGKADAPPATPTPMNPATGSDNGGNTGSTTQSPTATPTSGDTSQNVFVVVIFVNPGGTPPWLNNGMTQDPAFKALDDSYVAPSQVERLMTLSEQWSRVSRPPAPPPTAEEQQAARVKSLEVPFVLSDPTFLKLREALNEDRLAVDGPRSNEEILAIKLGYMLDATRSELLAVAEKRKSAGQTTGNQSGSGSNKSSDLLAYYKALYALYTDLGLDQVEVTAKYNTWAEGDTVLRGVGIDLNSDAPLFSRVGNIAQEIALGGVYGETLKDLGDEFTDLVVGVATSPRTGGLLQAVQGAGITTFGVGALGAPAPGARVAGVVLIANGVDNVQAGLVTLVTGTPTSTATAQIATSAFMALGASDDTAAFLGEGVNFVIPLAAGGWVKFAGTTRLTVSSNAVWYSRIGGADEGLDYLSLLDREQKLLSKGQILGYLDQGTEFSQELASLVRSGEIRLQYQNLAELVGAEFRPATANSVPIIQVNAKLIYENRLLDAAAAAVHDYQHVVDWEAGLLQQFQNGLLGGVRRGEFRAFARQLDFSLQTGVESEVVRAYLDDGASGAGVWIIIAYGFFAGR
jgi:hypothetical protein